MNQTIDTPMLVASILRTGEGPCVELGDHRAWVKVRAEQMEGQFLLSEIYAAWNGGVPPHIHRREDEIFYVLTGHFEFLAGEETVEAGAGDTVFGPRDVPHAWRCVSPEGGRMLVMISPGDNFQAFAQEMGRFIAEPQDGNRDSARLARFDSLCARYGVEMLPPLS